MDFLAESPSPGPPTFVITLGGPNFFSRTGAHTRVVPPLIGILTSLFFPRCSCWHVPRTWSWTLPDLRRQPVWLLRHVHVQNDLRQRTDVWLCCLLGKRPTMWHQRPVPKESACTCRWSQSGFGRINGEWQNPCYRWWKISVAPSYENNTKYQKGKVIFIYSISFPVQWTLSKADTIGDLSYCPS